MTAITRCRLCDCRPYPATRRTAQIMGAEIMPATGADTNMTTITHEQFNAVWSVYTRSPKDGPGSMKDALVSLGITTTPAEPPEAMVEMARRIVLGMPRSFSDFEGEAAEQAALAALQHVQACVNNLSWRSYESVPEFARDVVKIVGAA